MVEGSWKGWCESVAPSCQARHLPCCRSMPPTQLLGSAHVHAILGCHLGQLLSVVVLAHAAKVGGGARHLQHQGQTSRPGAIAPGSTWAHSIWDIQAPMQVGAARCEEGCGAWARCHRHGTGRPCRSQPAPAPMKQQHAAPPSLLPRPPPPRPHTCSIHCATRMEFCVAPPAMYSTWNFSSSSCSANVHRTRHQR